MTGCTAKIIAEPKTQQRSNLDAEPKTEQRSNLDAEPKTEQRKSQIYFKFGKCYINYLQWWWWWWWWWFRWLSKGEEQRRGYSVHWRDRQRGLKTQPPSLPTLTETLSESWRLEAGLEVQHEPPSDIHSKTENVSNNMHR